MEQIWNKMKKNTFLAFAAVALTGITACTNRNDVKVPEQPEIVGIAAPITLQPDSTHLVLQDYFLHPNAIDSVILDPSLGYRISGDSTNMTLFTVSKSVPKLSVLDVYANGFRYSVLVRKSPKVWYRFTFDPKEKKHKSVLLAGDMNDWVPARNPMRLNDNVWETDVLVNPGKYQYKIVVDGKWITDPAGNEKNGSNSVVRIGSVNPPAAPCLYTVNEEKGTITLGMRNRVDTVFVLWQNYLLESKFWSIDSNLIRIRIPAASAKLDRSSIRVFAANGSGISNEVLIPLTGDKVVKAPEDLERNDPHGMVMYFMMIDRFLNGDKDNDKPLVDPEIDPKVNFMGGDLSGIIKKTEEGYFSDLGVNTLWISPLTQNPPDGWKEYPAPHRKFSGYHGYWPITLTTVDSRFGTSGELKQLVSESHDKNMNVLLDYVSNHVHQESKIYKDHPDWATPGVLPNGQKNIRLWNEQRLTTWFDDFLPTLDLSKPEVAGMMSDSALFWIKEYGLDGFRHDAAKHVDELYWRTLTRKLKEQVIVPDKRPVYQIGESFGSRELIKSYIGPGMMDAQFDFNVYFDATTAFRDENSSLKDLNYSLSETFFYFGNHHEMGNITGNQDLTRFISIASGALSPTENAVDAGWKRDIEVKDTLGYYRLAMLEAFNMTIPGIPVIYYGDEYGMAGASDPDNRRMMKFDSLRPLEMRTKEITSKLVHLRRSSMPLLYGDFSTIEVGAGTWVYMRSYFDQAVIVVFNRQKSTEQFRFELPERFANSNFTSNFGNELSMDKGTISMSLGGNSFDVLTIKPEK
jgi:cyclomaltodextrinase / maltogenic alpha-amylase / neopullulanase